MIRHRRGDEFLLITQDDHAELAASFAERFGNDRFAAPAPRQPVIDAVSLHDAGWPLHDDRPTLNPLGEPLHVLEVPVPIATRVWNESVRLATERHPYTGLLVSLHTLNLASLAQRHQFRPEERARTDPADLFELNKFQHRQIEVQESLRRELDMRTDLPLRLGLSEPGAGGDEDRLRFDFGLLRFMDSLSLDVCSGDNLFTEVQGIHPKPGETSITFRIGHPAPLALTVDPWPFGLPKLEFQINARRASSRPFAAESEFLAAYDAAPSESLTIRLRPR